VKGGKWCAGSGCLVRSTEVPRGALLRRRAPRGLSDHACTHMRRTGVQCERVRYRPTHPSTKVHELFRRATCPGRTTCQIWDVSPSRDNALPHRQRDVSAPSPDHLSRVPRTVQPGATGAFPSHKFRIEMRPGTGAGSHRACRSPFRGAERRAAASFRYCCKPQLAISCLFLCALPAPRSMHSQSSRFQALGTIRARGVGVTRPGWRSCSRRHGVQPAEAPEGRGRRGTHAHRGGFAVLGRYFAANGAYLAP
jgi:hypothetical protein